MIDRSIPPVVADFAELHLPAVKQRVLSNGARLVIIADGTQPVAQLAMNWTGGVAEASSIAEAKMVSAGLREGSASATADELEELLDFNGAQLRALANNHYSSVSVAATSGRLASVLPMVLDAVYHPSFPAERIDRVRQRIIAARNVDLERVEVLAAEESMRHVAGSGHYCGRTLQPNDVLTLTIDQMSQWHRRVYIPSTMTAYLSGDISETLEHQVVQMLEAMSASTPVIEAQVKRFNTQPTPQPVFVEKPGAQQCAVNISIPTIDRRHPDYANLRLAIYALGGYFGSRLMSNIREERGLTYGINALLYGYREGGVVEITASTSPQSVDELISETIAEIKRMLETPLSADEMQRVRRGYFTRLAATLDTPFGISDFIMSAQLNDSPADYFDQQINSVRNANPEMIASLIDRYVDPSQAVITVAGVKE